MRVLTKLFVFAVLSLQVCWAVAEPKVLTIEGTRIRGNQELPTVLYVVPWQPPEVRALEKPKLDMAIKQPLKTIERSEFQRQIQYHAAFKEQNAKVETESQP